MTVFNIDNYSVNVMFFRFPPSPHSARHFPQWGQERKCFCVVAVCMSNGGELRALPCSGSLKASPLQVAQHWLLLFGTCARLRDRILGG